MSFSTRTGSHPSIKINVLDELPEHRYLAVLKRIRDSIASGRQLSAFDDTSPGNKSMGCSWGLCDETKATWPDAEDHTFPVDFQKHGRCSPLETADNNPCPMDMRESSDGNGCFYSCRVFKNRRKKHLIPTREQALELYDKAIEKLSTP